MVDFLVEIIQESYHRLKEDLFILFGAIYEKLEPLKQTGPSPSTDTSAQEDSEDEGEDLMETDDEEEDTKSETEEAF